MASIVTLPFQLTAPPAEWSKPSTQGKISAPVQRTLYPAGPAYIAAARRQLLNRTFEQDDEATHEHRKAQADKAKKEQGEELYPGLGEEKEDPALLRRDAKEWKKQDHYAVLGLHQYRYTATEDQIRVAHRRKVLRHHPDKKASGSSGTNDDNFFKCIQKAFETLLNPETRRQFDSVDPAIEDHVPNAKSVSADEYCSVFGPIFAREARFSKKQPVPSFGDMNASKQEVESFYDFWYNFDSWRSFEALDKEVNEGSDSRDEKRYQEKKNKAERARLKKEDNTRLREMVDMVLANDPRIKRIKAEEKAAREAKKKGGAAGGKAKPLTLAQKKAEEVKKAEEAKKAAEEAKAKEAEEKVQREAAKKARDAAKKNLKKWKKSVTNVVSESNYFQPEGTTPSAATVEKQLTELDTLFELLEVDESKELKEVVEKAGKGDAARDAIKAKASVAAGRGGKFEEFA